MKTSKKITRTFTFTLADLVLYNDETDSVLKDSKTLIGKMDASEVKKELAERYENTNLSVVKVVNVWYFEKLYGITEEDFLSMAVEMPPRKVNETQEDV